MFKKDNIDINWISNRKELFFFKMHDQEIFHTFEGSKDMNYSMMPPKIKSQHTFGDDGEGASSLDLRKSKIPVKPQI